MYKLQTGFLVLLTLISVVAPASAREKTDVVILKNGDHVTCEIKSLARGMLTVKTDSMGTVEIKWQDVERITSKFLFTVQDTNGQLYVGALQPADEARRVNVSGSREGTNLDHISIVQMAELEGSCSPEGRVSIVRWNPKGTQPSAYWHSLTRHFASAYRLTYSGAIRRLCQSS